MNDLRGNAGGDAAISASGPPPENRRHEERATHGGRTVNAVARRDKLWEPRTSRRAMYAH